MSTCSGRIFLVDAFADGPFTGNPAGVCVLAEHAEDTWMQAFASEMNQAETAFVVRREDGDFDLQWFTPTVEVALCGHATLASAHALWGLYPDRKGETLGFHTKSGLLTAEPVPDGIRLDFPVTPATACEPPEGLEQALGARIVWCGMSKFDVFAELESDVAVRSLTPDIAAIGSVPVRGVAVTASSEKAEFDFVSRFFAPASGVAEDHATGSAHCALAPYWAEKLGKPKLRAFQASKRGGYLTVEVVGDRAGLIGRAVTVFEGSL